MNTYIPRNVHVRPELDRMAQYVPGESPEAFSARTGIAVDCLIPARLCTCDGRFA